MEKLTKRQAGHVLGVMVGALAQMTTEEDLRDAVETIAANLDPLLAGSSAGVILANDAIAKGMIAMPRTPLRKRKRK